jgi:hypothetical protein
MKRSSQQNAADGMPPKKPRAPPDWHTPPPTLGARLVSLLQRYYCEASMSVQIKPPQTGNMTHDVYVVQARHSSSTPEGLACHTIHIQDEIPVCVYHKVQQQPNIGLPTFKYTETSLSDSEKPVKQTQVLQSWCCLRCRKWGPIAPLCLPCCVSVLRLSVHSGGPAGCGLFSLQKWLENDILAPYMGVRKMEEAGDRSSVYSINARPKAASEPWSNVPLLDAAPLRSVAAFINQRAPRPPLTQSQYARAGKMVPVGPHGERVVNGQEMRENVCMHYLQSLRVADIQGGSIMVQTKGNTQQYRMPISLLPLMATEAVWAVATRAIDVNHEVLLDYGPRYWMAHPPGLEYKTVDQYGLPLCCGLSTPCGQCYVCTAHKR